MTTLEIVKLVVTLACVGVLAWRIGANWVEIGRLRAEIQELREQVSRVARGAQRP